ncbi:hypothetical protein ACKTEK_02385 [Tepidamorphus sp. 3E244]|uniref:hypothetical protein n=1 Tax=Tepidamorphus sp. 3E244 TaxID=3385498 RepID=UPI0038FD328F
MFRPAIAAAFVTAFLATPAMAEECAGKVARLMVEWTEFREPTVSKMEVVTEGQGKTHSEFAQSAWDHYLYKPTEPAGGPWYLTHDGTMYQSTDEGGSWVALHSFDKQDTREKNIASVEAQAQTVENAVCGEETLDGVAHETLEADTHMSEPTEVHTHAKYWVNKETGFVSKSIITMQQPGFQSTTTQVASPAPDLTLPLPE